MPTPAPVNVSSAVRGLRNRVRMLRQAIAPRAPSPQARCAHRPTMPASASVVSRPPARRTESDSSRADHPNAIASTGIQMVPAIAWSHGRLRHRRQRGRSVRAASRRDRRPARVRPSSSRLPSSGGYELEQSVERSDRRARRRVVRLSGSGSSASPAGSSRSGRSTAARAATRSSRRAPIGASEAARDHPDCEADAERDAGQSRRSEGCGREQTDRAVAIAERLGGDDPWVDGLRDAGHDAEPDHGEQHQGAEDHREVGGVVGGCDLRRTTAVPAPRPITAEAIVEMIAPTCSVPPWRIAPRRSRHRNRTNVATVAGISPARTASGRRPRWRRRRR